MKDLRPIRFIGTHGRDPEPGNPTGFNRALIDPVEGLPWLRRQLARGGRSLIHNPHGWRDGPREEPDLWYRMSGPSWWGIYSDAHRDRFAAAIAGAAAQGRTVGIYAGLRVDVRTGSLWDCLVPEEHHLVVHPRDDAFLSEVLRPWASVGVREYWFDAGSREEVRHTHALPWCRRAASIGLRAGIEAWPLAVNEVGTSTFDERACNSAPAIADLRFVHHHFADPPDVSGYRYEMVVLLHHDVKIDGRTVPPNDPILWPYLVLLAERGYAFAGSERYDAVVDQLVAPLDHLLPRPGGDSISP